MKFSALSAAIASCIALAFAPVMALASPVSYVTVPLDTVNASINTLVSSLNSTQPWSATTVTCSGTTTSTCTGLRAVISVTGLTTAAGVTSASMVVTDTSVTASSTVFCQANGYGGTGNPMPVNVVPTASTITFQIQNTHASAALNATVPVACLVYN